MKIKYLCLWSRRINIQSLYHRKKKAISSLMHALMAYLLSLGSVQKGRGLHNRAPGSGWREGSRKSWGPQPAWGPPQHVWVPNAAWSRRLHKWLMKTYSEMYLRKFTQISRGCALISLTPFLQEDGRGALVLQLE